MPAESIRTKITPFFLLALPLIFLNIAVVLKFIKAPYVVPVLALVPVGVLLMYRCQRILEGPRGLVFLAVAFALLVGLFFLIYPLTNEGYFAGGPDRDEDLNIAVTRLLHFQYPYDARTSLNNQINSFPGSILLAIPAVLLGNSAYQNFFWILLFFWTLASACGQGRAGALCLILFFQPEILKEILTGGSLVANGLQVFVCAWWTYKASFRESLDGKTAALLALLGVALSSRVNYLFVLPVLGMSFLKRRGPGYAVSALAITVAAYGAVTFPFILYDIHKFSPLENVNRFLFMDPYFAGASRALPLMSLGFALGVACLPFHKKSTDFLYALALPQIFPVLLLFVVPWFFGDTPGIQYTSYGQLFIFFLSTALWMDLGGRPAEPKH